MNATTRPVEGNPFGYVTTAPVRPRMSGRAAHYLAQADQAEAGVTFPALDLVLSAAEVAAGERDQDETNA